MSWNFLAPYKKILPLDKINNRQGFGLVELMVSISIITIITGTIMARQSSFNSAILLRSQAYEIALKGREVQLSAVSVGATSPSEDISTSYRTRRGLYFNSDTGFDGIYNVFIDSGATPNGMREPTEDFEKQGRLDSRFEVREIKVGGTIENDVSIIFSRPNFDPVFYTTSGGLPSSATTVEIKIYTRDNVTNVCGKDWRTIEFTKTGQIVVKDCT